MTVSDHPTAITAPPIPRPRDAEPDQPPAPEVAGQRIPELPPAQYPWPEPWRWSRGALPRTEFWDVATGSWRSRGPVLHPKDD
jgi:hypothetical protein